jgi:hypothetical protein
MEYSHPRIKGRLSEWFEPRDGGMILDVGAGSGYFIFELMGKCWNNNVFFCWTRPFSGAHQMAGKSKERGETQECPCGRAVQNLMLTNLFSVTQLVRVET